MVTLSDFHFFLWGLIVVGLVLVSLGRFRERAFVAVALSVFLIGDLGISGPLKSFFARPRPYQALAGVRVVDKLGVRWSQSSQKGPFRSFPSGHACNTAALATVTSAFYFPWGRLLWIWAFLVGYSRVYGGHHYPTDVIGSWLLGWAYARLLLWIFRHLWVVLGRSLFPTILIDHPDLVAKTRGNNS